MDRGDIGLNNRDLLLSKFKRWKNDFKNIPDAAEYCFDNPHLWQTVTFESAGTKEFDTFKDWVEAPTPWGLSTAWEFLLAMCRLERTSIFLKLSEGKLKKIGAPMNNQNAKKENNLKTHEVVLFNAPKDYSLGTLRRVRPDLYEKVAANEIKRNAAYIEAGIIKKRVKVEYSVEGFARYINNHFTKKQINELSGYLE